MSRQISAIVVGVAVAIAVIYAVFDERVSFRKAISGTHVSQSQQSN
jgi:hypothetical protein